MKIRQQSRVCVIVQSVSRWTDPLRMWIRSVLYLRGVSSARRTCRASNTFPSSRYSRYFCCSSRNFILCTGKIKDITFILSILQYQHMAVCVYFNLVKTFTNCVLHIWWTLALTWLEHTLNWSEKGTLSAWYLSISVYLIHLKSFHMATEATDQSHNWFGPVCLNWQRQLEQIHYSKKMLNISE